MREVDPDHLRDVMRPNENKRWKIVKLDCCGNNVEITRPEDQYITCPQCFKTHLLIWSRVGKFKIKEQ